MDKYNEKYDKLVTPLYGPLRDLVKDNILLKSILKLITQT